jgi:hypothetical protein
MISHCLDIRGGQKRWTVGIDSIIAKIWGSRWISIYLIALIVSVPGLRDMRYLESFDLYLYRQNRGGIFGLIVSLVYRSVKNLTRYWWLLIGFLKREI